MPLMSYKGFLGPSYASASYMAATERLVNFYLEKNETPNASSPFCLLNTPGFTTLCTVPEGPIRAMFTTDTQQFFVAGFRFYELGAGDVPIARGTLAADARPATISWNGPNGGQLYITSGDVGYCYDLTTHTLTTVLASGASMGAFLGGFFLSLNASLASLQISALFDGTAWDPTQIVQRSAAPDPWIAMTVINNEIWLMGSQTTEVWFFSGAFPFPFEPVPGQLIEQGCAAAFSASRDVSPLLWVTQNKQGALQVVAANGYTPQRISTHGVERALQSYARVDDAVSFGYQEEGHQFYVLTFPTPNATWTYDVTEGAWHERPYWNTQAAQEEALRVRTHLYAHGRHLVGDRAIGRIYRMGIDLVTDVDGAAIRRIRQLPRVDTGQQRATCPLIQLVMDVGIGTITGQGSDPQVMLQTSPDGGKTWGPERWVSAGAIGAYDTRVQWRQNGQAVNRQDRFIFSDPVSWRITDALHDLRPGTS